MVSKMQFRFRPVHLTFFNCIVWAACKRARAHVIVLRLAVRSFVVLIIKNSSRAKMTPMENTRERRSRAFGGRRRAGVFVCLCTLLMTHWLADDGVFDHGSQVFYLEVADCDCAGQLPSSVAQVLHFHRAIALYNCLSMTNTKSQVSFLAPSERTSGINRLHAARPWCCSIDTVSIQN